MKTTIDVQDQLLIRAKRRAAQDGVTLRELVEDGLRRVLDEQPAERYALADFSVGKPGGHNPLQDLTWAELREEMYRR